MTRRRVVVKITAEIIGDDIPRKNANPPDPIFKSEYPTEKKWQATVSGWFKQMGLWMTYHTHTSINSASGFPDLVCVHTTLPLTLYAELKTETGAVTETQATWLNALAKAGNEVYLWRPSDTDEIQAVLQRANDDAFSLRERGFIPKRGR
jgi:hypothetical protein